jgi:hypothetical protein
LTVLRAGLDFFPRTGFFAMAIAPRFLNSPNYQNISRFWQWWDVTGFGEGCHFKIALVVEEGRRFSVPYRNHL